MEPVESWRGWGHRQPWMEDVLTRGGVDAFGHECESTACLAVSPLISTCNDENKARDFRRTAFHTVRAGQRRLGGPGIIYVEMITMERYMFKI